MNIKKFKEFTNSKLILENNNQSIFDKKRVKIYQTFDDQDLHIFIIEMDYSNLDNKSIEILNKAYKDDSGIYYINTNTDNMLTDLERGEHGTILFSSLEKINTVKPNEYDEELHLSFS